MLDSIEHVFVDESGNAVVNTSELLPDFYVICSIMCPDSSLNEFKSAAQTIVSRHAGPGELKSSRIRSFNRRARILRDIADQSFSFYCLVINKTSIWRDSGLVWNTSFYKFLHRMFYTRIKGVFAGIDVLADVFGTTEFMESFKLYIQNQGSLFDNFHFKPSPEVPLLQIADVVGGSVRRVFMGDDPIESLEILGYPSVPIEQWPPLSSNLSSWSPEDTNIHDKLVYELSISSARTFIEENITGQDMDKRMQAEAIRYLLFRFQQNPEEYVFRIEVLDHINSRFDTSLQGQTLSTRILAPARDAGVILSSTDRGVKIPYCVQDLRDWIMRVNSQAVPYLERVRSARNKLLMASHNEYDIIDSDLFPSLLNYLS